MIYKCSYIYFISTPEGLGDPPPPVREAMGRNQVSSSQQGDPPALTDAPTFHQFPAESQHPTQVTMGLCSPQKRNTFSLFQIFLLVLLPECISFPSIYLQNYPKQKLLFGVHLVTQG